MRVKKLVDKCHSLYFGVINWKTPCKMIFVGDGEETEKYFGNEIVDSFSAYDKNLILLYLVLGDDYVFSGDTDKIFVPLMDEWNNTDAKAIIESNIEKFANGNQEGIDIIEKNNVLKEIFTKIVSDMEKEVADRK